MTAAEMTLGGLPAAPGVAIGPAWRPGLADGGGVPLPDVRAAADRAAAELLGLAERVRAMGRPQDAEILDAQALMAVDPMLLDEAEARARSLGSADPDGLAAAVEAVARAVAEALAALPDELLAARAADVRDVGSRIARIVAGRRFTPPDRPSIAIADDLPPSVTAELPAGSLLGIALEGGSPVSHAAILARGLGIPAIVAVQGLCAAVDAAMDVAAGAALSVAVDGDAGTLTVSPTPNEVAGLERRAAARRAAGAAARELRGRPGQTADGLHVALLANIGGPNECARAIEAGAEGVGLFRTEFLYIGRADPPSEDEQVQAYAEVLRSFGPDRPVVIRLADIGGDKAIPYLHLPEESNPFLGVRGLRLAHEDGTLTRTQVRAIARAGAAPGVDPRTVPRVMAPMVSTQEDVDLLHAIVADALESLDAEGHPRAATLAVGIMVEVPSAALCAAELAASVAFFSIGSNDLTQYVLAMDRTNARLAAAADGLHPAVLRAVRATIEGADGRGIPAAVCGELASDLAGAAVLVGLGVDELSMDAGSLDAVRLMLSRVTSAELRELASVALAARSASGVRTAAAALIERR